jgi:hypothetical protein
MQRITSLFGVALVGASISIGALVASGIGTESQHNTPVAVNAAAPTIGNAQPGVVISASAFAPVQSTAALSIQPGLSQPDPAAPSVAARPASTRELGMAQPGVDLRAPEFVPSLSAATLSVQPGLPRPDARPRMAGADVDLTALAYAAAYDQCAAKALAETMAS